MLRVSYGGVDLGTVPGPEDAATVPLFDWGIAGAPDQQGQDVHLPCGCTFGPEGRAVFVITCHHMRDVAELRRAIPKPKRGDTIGAFRRIVETATAGKVGACRVDTFSASAVVQVYDKLGEANRAKFAAMDPRQMVLVAFDVLKKAKAAQNGH